MGFAGEQGQEPGKRNGALAQGKVIPFFGMVIVEVGADQARSQSAQVLLMIDEAKKILGGGMSEIVPIAEGGGGEFVENLLPKIIGRNFPGILTALQTQPEAQGLRFGANA